MSRTSKRLIVGTVIVLQLASLIAIGYLAVRGWGYQQEAMDFAKRNGYEEAVNDYRRGHRRILEVKSYRDGANDYSGRSYDLYEKESAKRKDGPYDVWWVMIPDNPFFAGTAKAYVGSYNSAMRRRVEKPEQYTPAGDPIPGSLKPTSKPLPRGTI